MTDYKTTDKDVVGVRVLPDRVELQHRQRTLRKKDSGATTIPLRSIISVGTSRSMLGNLQLVLTTAAGPTSIRMKTERATEAHTEIQSLLLDCP